LAVGKDNSDEMDIMLESMGKSCYLGNMLDADDSAVTIIINVENGC